MCDNDNDNDFVKLFSLPGKGKLFGYKYKSQIGADLTLLLMAQEVLVRLPSNTKKQSVDSFF